MNIPINDLRRHNDSISAEIETAIKRVLTRGRYILGPEVESFEAEFAAYCGVDHCVGVGSGTDALELALRALNVGPGDQVATVANAGMYSSTAIILAGAEPLYVDIDPQYMTMDPNKLHTTLTARTRAAIITHLYGQMADMPRLVEVANQAGIPVVEDCAQAHGAHISMKRAGNWGCMGCFSFYPTKNLGAMGDGGAIVTADADLAKRVRILRQYGWTSKYHSSLSGGRNSRMDDLQAAILRAKLLYLDQWNARRREIAKAYNDGLNHLDLILPQKIDNDYIAHLYVLRSSRRNQIKSALTRKGIGTDIHYPVSDYQQRSYAIRHSDSFILPITEKCCKEVLTLPCFPEMTDKEVKYVIDETCSIFD